MKETVVRKILEALPDWFAMEEGREQYIRESSEQICIGAAKETEHFVFLHSFLFYRHYIYLTRIRLIP